MSDPRTGRRWLAVRAAVLASHPPLCHRCGSTIHPTCNHAHPCSRCATVDHYPVPLIECAAHGVHPHDPTNLRPCCRKCNITAGASLGGRRLVARNASRTRDW